MTPERLAELRGIATAAPSRIAICSHGLDRNEIGYLATFDPPTALEMLDEIDRLRAALRFYCDGFVPLVPPPSRLAPGIEWRPTEALLDDCGNIARDALGDTP